MLTRFFLGKSARELGVDAKRITDAALQKLQAFEFPGNVRQLENICHWLTVMAPAQVVEAKDLPPELLRSGGSAAEGAAPQPGPVAEAESAEAGEAGPVVTGTASPLPGALGATVSTWLGDLEREARRRLESGEPEVWDALTRQFEGRLIHTALELTRGRRIEAAQRLGIGRNTITRKIQELGLDD
jgi:two-component system nitrogen regulation response regulator GlnG